MAMLANISITTALTAAVTQALQTKDGNPEAVLLQANFTYGSGGTTASAWVQTSVDQGVTWIDIANFSFTTASARTTFNLSALTPVTTQYTPTDGSLTANTAKDGQIGNLFRVKTTTTGTYVGTTLRIDAVVRGRLTSLT